MQVSDFFVLIYIMLRIVPSSYLCYYPFLDQLRLPKRTVLLGFCGIILAEWLTFINAGRNFDNIITMYGFAFLYIFYYFCIVRGHLSKQLFCVALAGNFEIVVQSFAMVSEQYYGLSQYYYATALSTLLLFESIYFGFFYSAFTKFKDTFLNADSNRIITLCNYIMLTNFMALVLIRNFAEPRSWNLCFARLLCALPLLLFMYLVMLLLVEIRNNKIINVKLETITALRNSEKHYYDFVIETWQNSRRVRHDLRHYAVLLNEYMNNKEYDKLQERLQKLLNYTNSLKRIILSGNEIIDGIVGYWQLQAEEKNIRFTTDIAFKKIKIDDIDLSIVLGNALENAFRAVQSSTCNDPFIEVRIKEKAGLLLLDFRNNYTTPIVLKDDKFYSRKCEYASPGTGVENIKVIVEKYQGYHNISITNNIFHLQLAMSNIERPKEENINPYGEA